MSHLPSFSQTASSSLSSLTPYSVQKRRREDSDGLQSFGSNQLTNEVSTTYSANDNFFSGNIGNFQSNNTIQHITYFGRYPELRRFLSPLDPEVRHATIREKLAKGTGRWLINSDRFQGWKECNGPQVLCLLGEPGTGKSSVLCQVIDRLRSEEKAYCGIVASLYCDYLDRGQYSARNVIGALLSQIVVRLSDKSDVIKQLEERRTCNHSLTVEECATLLHKAATSGDFKVVWLCLDALDELDSQERDKLLRHITTICQLPLFRFFLTGRSNAGVDTGINLIFRNTFPPTSVDFFPLTAEGTSGDIRLFLEEKLGEDGDPSLMDDALRNAIFNHLAGKESTFLLAALNIDQVLRGKSIRRREDALKRLTLNLDDYYKNMVERIKRQDEDYGIKVLHWILFALRPLSLQELRYAVAIEPGTKDFDPKRDLPSPSIIDSTLGLVALDIGYWGQNTVRFVHFTFKEYLSNNSSLHFPQGHALLAEAALAYLSLDAMSTAQGRRRYAVYGDLYAFSWYAFECWGSHARLEEEEVVESVCRFLESDKFSSIMYMKGGLFYFDSREWCTSPLHAVSCFDLSVTLTHIIHCQSQGRDASIQQGDNGMAPLPSAAARRDVSTAKCGWGWGNINANLLDDFGSTPLMVAICRNHVDTVKVFLEWKDINVNLPDKEGQTPLLAAALQGQDDIVELLLERENTDVNLADKDGQTPVSAAAASGHDKVVELLLQRENIDVNLADKHGWTPLLAAVLSRQVKTAKLLLERTDIDVNLADRDGRTPLLAAVLKRQVKTAKLLLERKETDVNLADKEGRSPLLAAAHGQDKMVELLLERENIDVNLADKDGQTPVLAAALWGHDKVVELLLERENIDVNLADKDGQTPLLAATNGHDKFVEPLGRKDTDVNLSDTYGSIPLRVAALMGRNKIVGLLLARKDTDVNLADKDGWTPLPVAALNRQVQIAKLLLERKDLTGMTEMLLGKENSHVDFFSEIHGTLLVWAAACGYVELVKELCRRNEIDVNSTDGDGQTALLMALDGGYAEVAEQLLERKDIDVNRADGDGLSPLALAVRKRCTGVVTHLLERSDIDVNLVGEDGQTPLQIVAKSGWLETLKEFLKEKDRDWGLDDRQMTALLADAYVWWRKSSSGLNLERSLREA